MKNSSHFFCVFSIVLASALGTSAQIAFAQDGEGISIETFKPSSSVNSIFETVLPKPKDHLEWSVGGLVSYAHKPMRRETSIVGTGEVENRADSVGMRVGVDLWAALGLFNFAEIGLVLPVAAFQDGEGGEPGGNIQPAGFGDPRLELKARFWESSGFSIGAGALVTAPLGHYASSGTDILGYKGPTAEPRLILGLDKGPIIVALNAGFLVRPSGSIANYDQNHALTWNAGFGFDLRDFDEPGGFRLAVETNGEAGIDFDTLVETPMEALLGIKYRNKNDLIFQAGAGPGMSTAVGTPGFRIFAGVVFDRVIRNCAAGPEDKDGFQDDDKCIDPDNDQDGILDTADKCPNDPEDFDKFEDEDGCPDTDNDGDTIPDTVDSCPMVPEDKDNFEDDDGCPEEGPGKSSVKITDSQLLISSKIYFDFDKAVIMEVSYPILNEVADALNANPQIKKLQIDGHTDNEGTEEYNLKLSEDRAKAVMEYLISKKVSPERLTYKGYGFSMPKASNRSEEGKAINRRVEFTILKKE